MPDQTALRSYASRRATEIGLTAAARELGLGVDVLARLIAGGRCHRGTLAQVAIALRAPSPTLLALSTVPAAGDLIP